jgi:hypothetical protein
MRDLCHRSDWQLLSSSSFVYLPTALKYLCEDKFQGGGWALVRRVKQGSAWHPATDNLAGTDVYGTANSGTATTFSFPFSNLVTSGDSLVMLATSTCITSACVFSYCPFHTMSYNVHNDCDSVAIYFTSPSLMRLRDIYR